DPRPMPNLDNTQKLELEERFAYRRSRDAEAARHLGDGRQAVARAELTVLDRADNPAHQLIREPRAGDGPKLWRDDGVALRHGRLLGAAQHAIDGDEHGVEARDLVAELFAASGAERVVARAPAGGRLPPLGGDPAFFLQPLERGVQRPLLDAQQ